MRTGLFIAAGLLVAALTAYAQTGGRTGEQKQAQPQEQKEKKSYLYQWTDDKGVTHITDELGKVPKKYRDKALTLESSKEGEAAQGQQKRASPSDYTREEEREANQKAHWQQRMREAKQRLADAEQRYRDLDQRRSELLGRWGGVASGRLQEREEAERITKEMQQVQREIDNARNQVEVVIPDEARKAGAEPGWLRE